MAHARVCCSLLNAGTMSWLYQDCVGNSSPQEPVGLDPGGDEETALQATTDFVGVSEDAQRSASPPPPPPEDESPEERLLRQKRELRTALERNDPDAVREILDAGVPLAIILDEVRKDCAQAVDRTALGYL